MTEQNKAYQLFYKEKCRKLLLYKLQFISKPPLFHLCKLAALRLI